MQARDAFGVFVRSLGVLALAYAMWHLGFAFSGALGYVALSDGDAEGYITTILTFSFTGLVLLRGADMIVKFAYLGQSQDSEL
jgi:hypothetical protein